MGRSPNMRGGGVTRGPCYCYRLCVPIIAKLPNAICLALSLPWGRSLLLYHVLIAEPVGMSVRRQGGQFVCG